jgi:hypothetical protein
MDCDCQGMNFAQARDAQIRNREANERASRAREAQQSLATALSTLDDAIGEQQLRVETLQERILTSAMHGTVVEIAKIPSGASSILSLAEPERIQSPKESVTELKLQNLALLFNWADFLRVSVIVHERRISNNAPGGWSWCDYYLALGART